MRKKLSNLYHGIGRYWFVILIGVGIIFGLAEEPSASYKPTTAEKVKQTANTVSGPLSTDFSLANGTLIRSSPNYFMGYGELTIQNGTDADALIKLVPVDVLGTPFSKAVATVYVKANRTHVLEGITDGSYKLFFLHGYDWNGVDEDFRRESRSSVFEEILQYETFGTQYTTYELTLNPVVGGNARTDEVPDNLFDSL